MVSIWRSVSREDYILISVFTHLIRGPFLCWSLENSYRISYLFPGAVSFGGVVRIGHFSFSLVLCML